MTVIFKRGNSYENRMGRYVVEEIDGDSLHVRYEDGTEAKLSIEIQQRIIKNIKSEKTPEYGEKPDERKLHPFHFNNEEKNRIKEYTASRRIEHLYHFTRIENIPSIVHHGIVPRTDFLRMGIQNIINDACRHDQFQNASSFSVGFPNYQLFYRFRKKDFPGTKWAVIEFPPELLWNYPCIFSPLNAASKSARVGSIHERTTKEAMSKIFEDFHGSRDGKAYSIKRESLRIPQYFPTNPQAEVLIFGLVQPEYISTIFFDDRSDLDRCKSQPETQSDHIRFEVNPALFKWRSDFREWKSANLPDQGLIANEMDDEIPF